MYCGVLWGYGRDGCLASSAVVRVVVVVVVVVEAKSLRRKTGWQ